MRLSRLAHVLPAQEVSLLIRDRLMTREPPLLILFNIGWSYGSVEVLHEVASRSLIPFRGGLLVSVEISVHSYYSRRMNSGPKPLVHS